MKLIIDTKKIILIAIIPLILSIGIIPALPFVEADVGPDTLCREGYVVVHRFQQNDYACMSMEIAKSWEALKTGQIVNSEPIKQSSPPSKISEDSQTKSMSNNPQTMEESSSKQSKCDTGLNLVINGMDGSAACVRPSSVQKLIESGWISIGSFPKLEPKQEFETEPVDSEPKVTTQLDFLPNEYDRAMYFNARFSEGLIQYEVIKTTFFKFTPFKEETVGISMNIAPENPLPLKTPFRLLLETLPNKENIGYYQAIEKYFSTDSTLFKPFDISIDVVSGDGTILQTWEYRDCDLEDYVVYLQDNVIYRTFTGENESEIRERSIFNCRGLSLGHSGN